MNYWSKHEMIVDESLVTSAKECMDRLWRTLTREAAGAAGHTWCGGTTMAAGRLH